ncbi:MAG: DUF255 domain-containing protein [Bacteroidaceae bacterium]|nr:DUF255 domain-containing protein [Bacteroidaceae bacterium]MBQ3189538.1 DUF255 domain-containing protein [Bacteroidaceae bacterium]
MKRQIHKMLLIAFVVCSCTGSAKQQQEQAQTPDTTVAQVQKEQKKEGTVFHELTLGEAMEKAKQEGKDVFIDCYTQSCAPCRQMTKLVFPQKECGDYLNANFICIKKDMQQDAEDVKYLNEKYKLAIFPTYLILHNDSTHVTSVSGAILDAGRFVETLRSSIIEAEAKANQQQ